MAVGRRGHLFFESEVGRTSSSERKQRRGMDASFPILQDESRKGRSERPRGAMQAGVHPRSRPMAIDVVVSHLQARSKQTWSVASLVRVDAPTELSNVSFSSARTAVDAGTQILHGRTFVSTGDIRNSLECAKRRPQERTSTTVDVWPAIADVSHRSNGWKGCGWKRWTRVERPRARLTKRRTGRRFPWPSPAAFVHARPSDAPWDKRRRIFSQSTTQASRSSHVRTRVDPHVRRIHARHTHVRLDVVRIRSNRTGHRYGGYPFLWSKSTVVGSIRFVRRDTSGWDGGQSRQVEKPCDAWRERRR